MTYISERRFTTIAALLRFSSTAGPRPCSIAGSQWSRPSIRAGRSVPSSLRRTHHPVSSRDYQGYFYFDFLEQPYRRTFPNLYLVSPICRPRWITARITPTSFHLNALLWIFDGLGYNGPMNEYLGVFWWNQRKRKGAVFPSVTVSVQWIFCVRGSGVPEHRRTAPVGRRYSPSESTAVIAQALRILHKCKLRRRMGQGSSMVSHHHISLAEACLLIYIRTRSADARRGIDWLCFLYRFTHRRPARYVDLFHPEQTPALNRGARDWHSGFFAGCHARNREVVVASSMELVNPPDGFASCSPTGRSWKRMSASAR